MAITCIAKRQDTPTHRVTGYLSGTYTIETVTNALLTVTNAEANGASAGGSQVGRTVTLDGSGNIVILPGFVPKYVKVMSATSRIQKEWFEGMNVTDSILTLANGTRSLVTTSGLLISTATSGTAPVTYEAAPSVTIDASVDTLIADSDTVVWVIEG